MNDTRDADIDAQQSAVPRMSRWQRLVGLAGLVGIAIAVVTTVDDVQGRTLPGVWALLAALGLNTVALLCSGAAWALLFPPDADRRALASGLYTSQLTKYLPAGGFVQVASQVTLAGQTSGLRSAALRFPVYSICTICAGTTLGSLLAFNTDLPGWARILTGLGVLTPLLLHRRVLSLVLGLARRVIRRLPAADELPGQRSINSSYLCSLGTLGSYAVAFTVLLGDLADVSFVTATAALSLAWVIGYVVVPLPSGIGVREGILIAALPGLGAGELLAASLAHRVLAIATEAAVAGIFILRLKRVRKAGPTKDMP